MLRGAPTCVYLTETASSSAQCVSDKQMYEKNSPYLMACCSLLEGAWLLHPDTSCSCTYSYKAKLHLSINYSQWHVMRWGCPQIF